MPNGLAEAHWPGTGPCLFSYNYGDGPYRVEYTDQVDTRWWPWVVLGPKMNFIDINAVVTAGSGPVTGIQLSTRTLNGNQNRYIYLTRGTRLVKVGYDNTNGTAFDYTVYTAVTTIPERSTNIFYTKSANGTEEISILYDDSTYDVVTAVGTPPAADTVSTAPTQKFRVGGLAGSDAGVTRVAGIGRGTGSINNTVFQNILSGSVTMASPNWVSRATIPGEYITPTGFNLDGDVWIIETSNGPYYLNADYAEFRPMFPEIPNTNNNSPSGAGRWSVLGVISPYSDGTRLIAGGESRSIGTSTFPGNYSQARGTCVAFSADTMWGYWNDYNTTTGYTYICAVRPNLLGDGHDYPVSFFTLGSSKAFLGLGTDIGGAGGTLADIESMPVLKVLPPYQQALDDPVSGWPDQPIGDESYLVGAVSSEAWWAHLTNAAAPWYRDTSTNNSSYRYQTSGTWYGEARLAEPELDKYVQYVTIETQFCSTTETITVSLLMDEPNVTTGTAFSDSEGRAEYHQVGYVIKQDGVHRLEVPPGETIYGAQIKPRVVMATGSSGASPIWRNLKVYYTTELRRQDGLSGRR